MINADLTWVEKLLKSGALSGPALELGAGYGGATCKAAIRQHGLVYYATDLERAPGVDFVADFEKDDDMKVFAPVAPFGSVLVLNVLEHTFNPIQVLDNAISLLRQGGSCAVLTPSIWPLHNYPMDAWRILPNFYEEYSKRRKLRLDQERFEYPGFGPVASYRNANGSYRYPPPVANKLHLVWSRMVHKICGTAGRAMFHPSHIAVAALLTKA